MHQKIEDALRCKLVQRNRIIVVGQKHQDHQMEVSFTRRFGEVSYRNDITGVVTPSCVWYTSGDFRLGWLKLAQTAACD